MDSQEKIDLIIEWAMDKKKFDLGFVMEMANKLDEGGKLTKQQERALDNIIEKCRILKGRLHNV